MDNLAAILSRVQWREVPPPADPGGLPYATHEGVLNVAGCDLRCYCLNDGRRIFHSDDLRAFLNPTTSQPRTP